jgi:hypothetical protein
VFLTSELNYLLSNLIEYYSEIYVWVFQVVSSLQDLELKFRIHFAFTHAKLDIPPKTLSEKIWNSHERFLHWQTKLHCHLTFSLDFYVAQGKMKESEQCRAAWIESDLDFGSIIFRSYFPFPEKSTLNPRQWHQMYELVRCSSGKPTSTQLDNATTAINYTINKDTMIIHFVRGF